MPRFDVAPQRSPCRQISRLQLCGREGLEAGCHCRDHAHGAAYHQRGRGALAPGGAAFEMARGAEGVLQIIVGSGEVGHRVAVEETGPVARRHLLEVRGSGGQCSPAWLRSAEVREQIGVRLLQRVRRQLVVIGRDWQADALRDARRDRRPGSGARALRSPRSLFVSVAAAEQAVSLAPFLACRLCLHFLLYSFE